MTHDNVLQQAPVLFALDPPANIACWADNVGFKMLGVWGKRANFAIAVRDFAHIMLTQVPEGQEIVSYWRIKNQMWSAYLWVDDAAAKFEKLNDRGAKIDYELSEQPYGPLEFGIQDLAPKAGD
jgi:uncharacterized glyoxalase superfamily protein PhnB